jgi:hypothetical protein
MTTTNRWIDERPIQEIVMDTPPTGKYDFVAEMIIRDPNVFRSSSTLYDIDLLNEKSELARLQRDLDAVRQGIKDMSSPPSKKAKAITAKLKTRGAKGKQNLLEMAHEEEGDDEEEIDDSSSWRPNSKALDKLYMEEGDTKDAIRAQQAKIQTMEMLRDISLKEQASLRNIASIYSYKGTYYKEAGDQTFLRHGVHWVCSYADTLRLKMKHPS